MPFNTTINTSLLTTYLIRKFIPTLENELQFAKFATDATLPQGMGNIARFNVFGNPPGTTTALTEGTVTGNATTITSTGTDATIAEYGEFVITTRLAEFAAVPGSRDALGKRMAYGAALCMDSLVRNRADATTSDWYAGTGVGGGASTAAGVSATYVPVNLSASAIVAATGEIKGNNAMGHRGVAGHPDRHFACIMSSGAETDVVLETTAGRMTWHESVVNVPGALGQGKWVNGYMGSIYGTACYTSNNTTLATLTNSADETLILGEGGVGAVSMIDADPQIYINTPSSQDVGNPYRNRATIAWHMYYATALIDSNRIIKIYSAAT